jgi:hypothetical protein
MFEPIKSFEVGQFYTNDELRFSLGVENLGGIRPSLDARGRVRHVAILTSDLECDRNISENPYADRIEGNILTYTAAGRQGDQALTGRNKRLVEQYQNPTPFFGFANVGRQRYRFLGLLQLVRHYRDVQSDGKGEIRNVWMFEFLIHSSPVIVRISDARETVREIFKTTAQNVADASEPDAVPSDSVMGLAGPELERVRSSMLAIPPEEFERFIARLFELSGFTGVHTTPFQGDGA